LFCSSPEESIFRERSAPTFRNVGHDIIITALRIRRTGPIRTCIKIIRSPAIGIIPNREIDSHAQQMLADAVADTISAGITVIITITAHSGTPEIIILVSVTAGLVDLLADARKQRDDLLMHAYSLAAKRRLLNVRRHIVLCRHSMAVLPTIIRRRASKIKRAIPIHHLIIRNLRKNRYRSASSFDLRASASSRTSRTASGPRR